MAKKLLSVLIVLAVCAILLPGCANTKTLCGSCGAFADSGHQCNDAGRRCQSCNLLKGSPGCCNITPGTDVELCLDCGHIYGSKKCCKADVKTCGSCKLHKGSPGCCKIPKN